jgi:GTP-binding protein
VKIDATFVTSAARAGDFPRDGLPEVALVGRSNVGKSSLINALVGRTVARTSAAPGKTRLANVYRVARGSAPPLYVVDLPGYGYARGGEATAREFAGLIEAYFGRIAGREGRVGHVKQVGRKDGRGYQPALPAPPASPARRCGLLLVDSRHPGLESDRAAWAWLRNRAGAAAIVATKIDKLSRAERQRAMRQMEAVFEDPALPVSAATGEGLEELWILIDRLANNRPRSHRPRSPNRL